MEMTEKNKGFIIGAYFAGGSVFLTASFIAPIISVLPGMLFETIAKSCISNNPYSNVGYLTILLLVLTFLLLLILCICIIKIRINKGETISKKQIIVMLSGMYFIVHSLGFYIYWGVSLNFASDGQTIFASVLTYPFSGLTFILIGLLFDYVKNV